MTKYAVGYANLYDNDLVVEIVEANSIKDAILQHSMITRDNSDNSFSDAPENIEDLKQYFFDMDTLVGAVCINT